VTGGAPVLVTGATGFIGGHLAQRLVTDGHRVRGLVRATSDTSLLEDLGIETAVGDLTDAASLAGVADGCEAVFHCGALVSDWAATAEIAAVNVAGTRNLLAAAAPVPRFVHVSTTDVHRADNWYARTKRAAEAEVRRVRGADTVILRPSTVYGPRSAEVVGEIAKAIRAGTMLLVDRGRANAGLCYVDNLVDAAVLARPGEFDITDGLDVTWRRFADDLAAGLGAGPVRWSVPYAVANAIGFSLEHGYRVLRGATGLTTRPLLSRQAVYVMGRDQDFDNGPARAALGWEPRVGYAEGMQATLAWLNAAPSAARRRGG
jgi:nucleoside-diphosphate-sugar epimerase